MDTKSKNYKTSFGIKFTAFCVAFVIAFSSAMFAIEAINNLYKYDTAILTKPSENLDATNTIAFYSQLTTDLQSIYAGSGLISWENYQKSYCNTFDEELSSARAELERFKKSSMSAAVDRYYNNSDDEYAANSESADSVTSATSYYGYTSSGTVVTPDYDEDYYNACVESYSLTTGRSGSFSISTATTDEELTQLVSNAYSQVMETCRREYETLITTESQNIQKFVNLKYYICNPTTGAVYTNIENVGSTDDVMADFSTRNWHMTYTAEGGLADSSPQVTRDMLYSTVTSENYYYNISSDYYTRLTPSMVLGNCFSDGGYDVYLALDNDLKTGDEYYNIQAGLEKAGKDTYRFIFASLAMLIVTGMLSVYLIYSAGRIEGEDGDDIRLTPLDRFPTDLHFVISGGIAMLGVAGIFAIASEYAAYHTTYSDGEVFALFAAMAAMAAVVWAVILEWISSVSKYFKSKSSWIKASFIYRFCRWIITPFKKAVRALKTRPSTVRKRTLTLTSLYVLINIILCSICVGSYTNQSDSVGFFMILLIAAFNLAVLSYIWKYILALDTIITASESSKDGNPPKSISGEKIPEPLRTLADNLYFTQEEMQKAVSEAVSGERMKTELITNVSHDLKTPLTSIISYVDLLKKCDIDDISAQKYINVLDEKSIRLKRLIEDLAEASKASSGAITFNKMNVNLYELALQAVGEMEEGFEANKLEIVLDEPENKPVIYADSQKTWRVIDNLLSNAKKYALEGSRVYMDIGTDSSYGTFTVKNTSREPLNIDPEELTQRFVRGDDSRTAEGSGLGLSIAKDLCTLQGGKLDIIIDGDLFKATVKMPLVFDPQVANENQNKTEE